MIDWYFNFYWWTEDSTSATQLKEAYNVYSGALIKITHFYRAQR